MKAKLACLFSMLTLVSLVLGATRALARSIEPQNANDEELAPYDEISWPWEFADNGTKLDTSLFYAAKTATPLIKVNVHSFYSVQNGVWFVASSCDGPWIIATSVPVVIYSIPVSSPLHYITYAQVYGSTADVVYVGYTPGNPGTEDCPEMVVAYGTGWRYPPSIGTYRIGWPGVAFADNWEVGFGFGFEAGIWLGTWCHPWWGSFGWGWHHNFDSLTQRYVRTLGAKPWLNLASFFATVGLAILT